MRNKLNNLHESAESFLNYSKTMKGLSKDTIKGYKSDLNSFFNFIKVHKKTRTINVTIIRSITLNDLHSFMMYLDNNCKNKELSRSRKTSTIKSYFDYLQNVVGLITINPSYNLKSPKKPKRNPIYLSLDESKQLLVSMDKNNEHYIRDYCIITLFLNCGMRLSELEGIKIENIKDDTLTVIGKGDKERTIYLNDACLKVLNEYLNIRDTYKITDGRLFNIKKRMIELTVKKYMGSSGINKSDKYTPHKLRHTSATLMLKYGDVDIRSLQEILGHENISATQIYTHVDSDMCRKAVKKNPLNNL